MITQFLQSKNEWMNEWRPPSPILDILDVSDTTLLIQGCSSVRSRSSCFALVETSSHTPRPARGHWQAQSQPTVRHVHVVGWQPAHSGLTACLASLLFTYYFTWKTLHNLTDSKSPKHFYHCLYGSTHLCHPSILTRLPALLCSYLHDA